MAGKKGFGTKLQYRSAVGPEVWTLIGDVTKIRPFSKKADILDMSSNESPAETREKDGGMIDNGECQFDFNYKDTTPSHEFLEDNVGKKEFPAGNNLKFRVIFPGTAPTKKVKTFEAIIQSVGPEVPFDGKMTSSCVLAISGVITTTADGS